MPRTVSALALLLLLLAAPAAGGRIAYGVRQAGCAAAWVACYTAAGLVAGTVTAGLGAPLAALGCNAALASCTASFCAPLLLLPTP